MASSEATLGSAGALLVASAPAEGGWAPPADAALVVACRRGEAEAFATLVRQHEGLVFNMAARLLGDGEEARDVAQEVFLQVYRTLGSFQGRSSLRTWIYRIVVNRARNRRRWWHRRRRERTEPLDELSPAEELRASRRGAGEEDPFQRVERLERARRVQLALDRVSFDHRAILLLREVEGLSGQEVATALGVPEGTVKSRLARAREALRRALAGGEEGGQP